MEISTIKEVKDFIRGKYKKARKSYSEFIFENEPSIYKAIKYLPEKEMHKALDEISRLPSDELEKLISRTDSRSRDIEERARLGIDYTGTSSQEYDCLKILTYFNDFKSLKIK